MHGHGKSDGFGVPGKRPNNAAHEAAEVKGERNPTKGNEVQQNASRTRRQESAE